MDSEPNDIDGNNEEIERILSVSLEKKNSFSESERCKSIKDSETNNTDGNNQVASCWVCFSEEDDLENGAWVKPCKCK
jgi:hypothetical protein